ncbi:shikimate kinase [Pseudooceanicola spongiae]|uniref:Shikimate kinase n=1 Tax=Pseudooceanicola spongiae TaxID=2613965 RepID=A0A7L9WJK9_9RHOB|nr:shikimate kinase [Pseudooceanicola spongiae]QOL80093.1 shikimate kinase [Pseudooceanicola spongiae]
MSWKLNKTVVMVGMMGAGKTAVGKALAQVLDVGFRDSDAEIELAANMSIAEIFGRDGESFFRDRESQVIARMLEEEPCVLSTGGGAFMSPANRKLISERGVSLWLNVDLDLLWSRVKHRDSRPLLKTPNPRATLRGLYETRMPIYAEADLEVRAEPRYSVSDMARHVVTALAQRPDVLEAV